MNNFKKNLNGAGRVNALNLTFMFCNGAEYNNLKEFATALYYKEQGNYSGTIKEFGDIRIYISRNNGITTLKMWVNGIEGTEKRFEWKRTRMSDSLMADIMFYIREWVSDVATMLKVNEVFEVIEDTVDADPYFESYMETMEEENENFDYAYELGNYIACRFEGYDDIVRVCVDEWIKANIPTLKVA